MRPKHAGAIVAGLLLCATGVSADGPHGQASANVFSDDMSTTIWSPGVSGGATLPEDIDLNAHWYADVITSASVDVITAATKRMDETRHEFGLAVSREDLLPDFDLSGAYTFSFENDGDAHTAQLDGRLGLFQNNVELGLSYGLSVVDSGLPNEPSENWRDAWIQTIEASVLRLLDRDSSAELSYTAVLANGYLASPYRRVPIFLGPNLVSANWVSEEVPDFRWRNAWTLHFERSLAEGWFLKGDYRFYHDDWGVIGHTEEAALAVDIVDNFSVEVQERGTWQGAADFYRERYTTLSEYRTRERRLSQHMTGLVGLALHYNPGAIPSVGEVHLRLSGDLVAWYYGDFSAPALTFTGGGDLETLGWVKGWRASLGVEIAP